MFYLRTLSNIEKLETAKLCLKRLSFGFALSLSVMACQPLSDTKITPTQPQATLEKKKTPKSASVVVLTKDPNGQFWTQARVNTGSVRFLVDTGASTVALTENDAKKAGIKTRDLEYDLPIRTAGGENYAARITLDRLSVGAITVKDVEAIVVPKGLDISLLGMTYLGELQSVEANRATLTLRY